MEILQRVFIFTLNPIYNMLQRVSKNTRYEIYKASIFFMVLFSYYGEAKDLMKATMVTNLCIIQTIFICIIVVMSMSRPLNIVKWNRMYLICWFGCSIVVIITGCIHVIGPGFRPMAIMMLFFYPGLFFVWNNRGNYHFLYDSIAKATVVISIGFFIQCMMVSPLINESLRYAGVTGGNPGSLGKVGIVAFTCGIYLLIRSEKIQWIYAVYCGMSMELIIASGSRTAFITMVVLVAVFIVLFIKENIIKGMVKVDIIRRITIMLIIVIVTIPMSHFLLVNGRALLHDEYEFTETAIYESIFIVVEASEENNQSHIQTEEQEQTNVSQKNEEEKQNLTVSRFDFRGKDLNTFFAGRMDIYQGVIDQLSLLGHDASNPLIRHRDGTYNTFAHNTALEITNRCGVIAGFLFLLIQLMTTAYVIKLIVSKTICLNHQYFMVFAIVGFNLMSLTDIVINPAAGPSMLFFFLAIAPLFKNAKPELFTRI